MKQKIDEPYLLHIKDAIEAIEIFIHGKTLDDFKKDDYFQSAVIRKLEVIGEAAKHVSPKIKMIAIDIPWEPIVAVRNRLIHGYFSIDEERVWGMVIQDIPKLKEQIRTLLK
jgi:uncharacterized protein with HEPN domain